MLVVTLVFGRLARFLAGQIDPVLFRAGLEEFVRSDLHHLGQRDEEMQQVHYFEAAFCSSNFW